MGKLDDRPVLVSGGARGIGAAVARAVVGASKWGVRGLTKSAALELARDGIRVNSVHPGLTRTPMTELTDPAMIALRDQVLAVQPIPRMGEADEVARLVMFLASDDGSFSVTGQVPPTAPA